MSAPKVSSDVFGEDEAVVERAEAERMILGARNPLLALAAASVLSALPDVPAKPPIPEIPCEPIKNSADKLARAEEKRRMRAFKKLNRTKRR